MSAATAPIVPAAFFADPARTFWGGVGAGDLLYGAEDGGLRRAAAGGSGSTLIYGEGGVLTATDSPIFAGLVTASTGLAVTDGGVEVTSGGVTVTAGGLTVTAGGAAVGGDSSVTGDLTVLAGDLAVSGVGKSVTVGALTLSGSSVTTKTGDLVLDAGANNIVITSGAPTSTTHLATKGYVDSVAQGLSVKSAVRLRTVGALPAYNFAANSLTAAAPGALSIDATGVTSGDRVLVDQNGADAGEDAGIYVVTSAGSGGSTWTLTRAADANTSELVTAGMFVFVTSGATSADKGFVLTTDAPIVLNTTALSFTQFSGSTVGAAGSSKDVQYNTSGSFATDTGKFTYDPSGGVLTTTAVAPYAGNLALFGEHTASDPGAAVYVGALTNQTADGDSVAFGQGSAVSAAAAVAIGQTALATAAHAIALGHDAQANVVGTVNTAAIPIGMNTTSVGSPEGGKTRAFATSIAALPSDAFDVPTSTSTATDVTTIVIPAGAHFFPLGAIAWCSSYTSVGVTHATSFLLTAGTGAGMADVASIDFTALTPSVGASRLQWSTTTNAGLTGTIHIGRTVSAAGTDTVRFRFALLGFLIEDE